MRRRIPRPASDSPRITRVHSQLRRRLSQLGCSPPRRAATAFVLASATACTFAVTEQRSVAIENSQPAAEKIALAERVVASVASGDLAGRVHALVPDAPEELIRALTVDWRRFVGVETTPDGPRPIDAVLLRCQITLPRADARAGPILDACKRLLEDAIDEMAVPGTEDA